MLFEGISAGQSFVAQGDGQHTMCQLDIVAHQEQGQTQALDVFSTANIITTYFPNTDGMENSATEEAATRYIQSAIDLLENCDSTNIGDVASKVSHLLAQAAKGKDEHASPDSETGELMAGFTDQIVSVISRPLQSPDDTRACGEIFISLVDLCDQYQQGREFVSQIGSIVDSMSDSLAENEAAGVSEYNEYGVPMTPLEIEVRRYVEGKPPPELYEKREAVRIGSKTKKENAVEFFERVWGVYNTGDTPSLFQPDLKEIDPVLLRNLRGHCSAHRMKVATFCPPNMARKEIIVKRADALKIDNAAVQRLRDNIRARNDRAKAKGISEE